MSTDQIERDVLIAAPPERVWALLTEAEHLGRWFGDAGAEIDLRPGGRLTLRWQEHGSVAGEVVAVEPHRRFVFRWAPYRDPGGVEPVEGNSTLITFTLAAEGDGTRVRVLESGFDALDCSPEQRLENLRGNTEGWQLELGELVAHAERVAV
ncbi:SRPBCC family protein [Patulibacter defluvii]|uniref:SRPBCC family protein n=1 Tax=Patulibacter defluvii TaxID=3095358 RepID=UPI002A74864B|nr:SRPBCC family protein [Patulibacter sp. DM4]